MEVWKALHVSAYISIKVWFKEHTILKKKTLHSVYRYNCSYNDLLLPVIMRKADNSSNSHYMFCTGSV